MAGAQLSIPTVFVTYATGDRAHETQVLSFVNYLRENGFDAVNDKLLQQQQTSIEFWDLMLSGFNRDKVVVVLSDGYVTKSKIEGSGVYREYHYILNDLGKNKTKYIFVVFSKPTDYSLVAPAWINSHDILNVSNDDGLNSLFAKLQGETTIAVTPVGSSLPVISQESVPNFTTFIKKN